MARATDHSDLSRCPARRTVLLGIGSASLLTAVGCGGSPSHEGAEPAGSGGTASAAASSGPAGAAPGGPAGGTGGVAPGATASAAPGAGTDQSYAPWPNLGGGGTDDGLVRAADVPVGGGVLAGELLVVQPQRGTFKAYDAKCPHQGVTVDPPLDGLAYMNCPGHNSKFKVSDGSRISGPAPRGLRQVAVKVRNGFVVRA